MRHLMLSIWVHCLSLWARKSGCTILVWRPHKKSKPSLGPNPAGERNPHTSTLKIQQDVNKSQGVCAAAHMTSQGTHVNTVACSRAMISTHCTSPTPHLPDRHHHTTQLSSMVCATHKNGARTSTGEKLWPILFLEQEEWAGVSTCKIIIRIYNTQL